MHVPLESITGILSFQMMKKLLGLFWPCSHLCVGTMRTFYITSLSYSITFIDEATKKCWIYFVKHKSEVFEKYCEFKSVEKQTGHGIQSKSWEVIMVEVKSWYWLLTMMIPLLLFLYILPLYVYFPLLLILIEVFIKWMWRKPSWMDVKATFLNGVL